jgi:hypothetical protein
MTRLIVSLAGDWRCAIEVKAAFLGQHAGKPMPMAELVDCLLLRGALRALARRDCYANQQD